MKNKQVNEHIRNVRNIIKNSERNQISEISLEYFRKQVIALCNVYTQTSPIIGPGCVIYRGIKYGMNNRPTHISGLTYPLVTKDRRANFEGDPLFYGSGDPRTVFFEINAVENDMVVLSKWRTTADMLLHAIGYSKEEFEKLGSSRVCPIIVPEILKHQNEFHKSNIKINRLFSEIFTKKFTPEKNFLYKFSAVIAKNFLSIGSASGLVYPSIAMWGNSENFVLIPSFVDNNLKLQSAKWIKIDKINNPEYTCRVIAYADSFENGQIEWREPTQAEKESLYS